MDNKDNLIEIIKLCKGKDSNAQHKLFNLYKNKMYAVCLRYSKSNTEAEDMMMEGWMRIFQYIAGYEFVGSFEAWMKRIMINNAINSYKSNIKHNSLAHQVIERNTEGVFENEYLYTEEELIKCVQRLPNSLRVLFNLSAIDEYSNKEIAELLNQTPDSIKSNLYKARKVLRDELTRIKEDGDR